MSKIRIIKKFWNGYNFYGVGCILSESVATKQTNLLLGWPEISRKFYFGCDVGLLKYSYSHEKTLSRDVISNNVAFWQV